MKISSLHLDEFFLTKLYVKHCGSYDNLAEVAKEDYTISINHDVARNVEEKNLYRLDFKVKISPPKKKSGISVDAELIGFFSFSPETPEEDMKYLIRINGCTILYGLLRGQVAMVTGNFPEGKFSLPSVVMHEILKKKRTNKKL